MTKPTKPEGAITRRECPDCGMAILETEVSQLKIPDMSCPRCVSPARVVPDFTRVHENGYRDVWLADSQEGRRVRARTLFQAGKMSMQEAKAAVARDDLRALIGAHPDPKTRKVFMKLFDYVTRGEE